MFICIEKRSLLTREAQGNSTGNVSCSAESFACPKMPDNVRQSGNPSQKLPINVNIHDGMELSI